MTLNKASPVAYHTMHKSNLLFNNETVATSEKNKLLLSLHKVKGSGVQGLKNVLKVIPNFSMISHKIVI